MLALSAGDFFSFLWLCYSKIFDVRASGSLVDMSLSFF